MPRMTDKKLPTQTTATDTAQATTHQEQRPSLLSSLLAIAGFITIIVIVLWGLFHIARLASPWFSSLFDKSAVSIQVSAPANVTSGENFTISWKYSTTDSGMYALLYQCKNNVRLEIPGAAGARSAIPCGAAYMVTPTGNTVVVRPTLSGATTTSLSLSIIFIPSATSSISSGQASSKQAQGSAGVVVHPNSIVMTTAISPPSPPRTVAPVTAKPQVIRPADISVRVLSINVDSYGMGVVEFDIANIGGSTTGTYTFEVFLPTQSGYTYSSPTQSPLGPEDHIVNTLRFSQATGGTVTIVVDPSNVVHESNENNNYASQGVSSGYPQSYQYPYVY